MWGGELVVVSGGGGGGGGGGASGPPPFQTGSHQPSYSPFSSFSFSPFSSFSYSSSSAAGVKPSNWSIGLIRGSAELGC